MLDTRRRDWVDDVSFGSAGTALLMGASTRIRELRLPMKPASRTICPPSWRCTLKLYICVRSGRVFGSRAVIKGFTGAVLNGLLGTCGRSMNSVGLTLLPMRSNRTRDGGFRDGTAFTTSGNP